MTTISALVARDKSSKYEQQISTLNYSEKDQTMTAFTETGTMINPKLLSGQSSGRKPASLLSDVVLVGFWAALVPGLMWLGSVVGF